MSHGRRSHLARAKGEVEAIEFYKRPRPWPRVVYQPLGFQEGLVLVGLGIRKRIPVFSQKAAMRTLRTS